MPRPMKTGQPWTREDIKKLCRWYKNGELIMDIAWSMGRSECAIRHQVAKCCAYRSSEVIAAMRRAKLKQ